MTSIYELEKQATPGPVHTDDGFMTNQKGVMIAQAGPDANGFDLDMLAHCRNHFMEALNGLKFASRNMSCGCSHVDMRGHAHDCETNIVDRLIAKLEEVR